VDATGWFFVVAQFCSSDNLKDKSSRDELSGASKD